MTDDLLTPPETNYFQELVGENKKFKTTEDLAKGKYVADNYILRLESQLDQLRGDYLKLHEEQVAKAGLQELLDRMNVKQPQPEQTPTSVEQKPTIDPRQIEDLIDSRMTQRERERTEASNIQTVKAKLEATLGTNYHDALQQRMTDVGISSDEFNQMARNNPKALTRLLDLDPVTPNRDPFAPPRNNIRTDQFKPNVEKRTWQWYQDLKQKDPKKYYSRETNVQMHKDALDLGAAFEDGDFGRFAKDFRISY